MRTILDTVGQVACSRNARWRLRVPTWTRSLCAGTQWARTHW